MKIINKFSFILIISLCCNDKKVIKNETNKNNQSNQTIKNKCDTTLILKNFKEALITKQINKINGYSNIPYDIIYFYKNIEDDNNFNDSVNKQFFIENFKYIFPDDFLSVLSMVDMSKLLKKGSFNKLNVKSNIFKPNVNFNYKVYYYNSNLEITVIYKFPPDDPVLDSETSIIYLFKIKDCELIIENVIMAG